MPVNRFRQLIGLGAVAIVPTVATPCMVMAQGADQELRAALITDLKTMGEKFVQLAEAFPQEKYEWRPMAGVRSVSELEENVRMFELPVPAALWQELKAEGLLPAAAPTPA